jgi:hypothetical protein
VSPAEFTAEGDLRLDSSSGGDQVAYPHQVVGCRSEGEHPIAAFHAAMPRQQTRTCPSGGAKIHPMPTSITRDVLKPSQSQAMGSRDLLRLMDPSALLRERFLTELAHYEADKPHLTADTLPRTTPNRSALIAESHPT